MESSEVLPHQDHGEAWLSVIAFFIEEFFLGGMFQSFGVIYIGLLSVFEAGEFKTSLVSTTNTIVIAVCSPIVGLVLDKLPIRYIVIFGSLMAAGGFCLCAFAPNIYYCIVGFGVLSGIIGSQVTYQQLIPVNRYCDKPENLLVGIGIACIFPSLMVPLGQYWNKRKSLATGIAFTGSAIGSGVLPLLYTVLNREYSVRGTCLIVGGTMLQLCISGMLVRTPPDYSVKPKSQSSQTKGNANGSIKEEEVELGRSTAVQNDKVSTSQENNTTVEFIPKNNGEKDDRSVNGGSWDDFKALVSNMYFIRIMFMSFLSTAGVYGTLYLLPALAEERGSNDLIASLTVSLTGPTEFFSKLFSGYLIDRYGMNRMWFWSGTHVISGLCAIATAYVESVNAVLLLAVMWGLCGTVNLSINTSLVSDSVKPKLAGQASGIFVSVFFIALGTSFAVLGEMRERTGSYVPVLLLFAGLLLCVAVIGTFDVVPRLARRLRSKNIRKSVPD